MCKTACLPACLPACFLQGHHRLVFAAHRKQRSATAANPIARLLCPQGHLRLVLLPIVYNALAQREDLHSHPLFQALHRTLRPSTYWPLLM